MPWYQRIPRTLLEDALNVISDQPVKLLDIFHFLCAANIVNAYVNQCNHHGKFGQKQITRMFQAKQQIFGCLLQLAEEHNPNVKIAVSGLPAVLANIKVEKHDYQISFRGMTKDLFDRFCDTGLARKAVLRVIIYNPSQQPYICTRICSDGENFPNEITSGNPEISWHRREGYIPTCRCREVP